MTIIEIHEFSTGINVKHTSQGWYSTGFSGHYMNSTLEEIPEAVRQAIAADLFKLSENAIQDHPAIIGREVELDLDNEKWSVLAVVSHASDGSGRPIEVTRYFLTKGLGNIDHLLTYQKMNELFFNPLDVKKIHKPHQYDTENSCKKNILDIIFENYLVILDNLSKNSLILSTMSTKSGKKIPIKAIHQLAEEKAKKDHHLISWAYNVADLCKPHTFLVIYPDSDQSDKNISRILQTKLKDKVLETIRTWVIEANVKSDDIVNINSALIDKNTYNDKYWHSTFNLLGIEDAKKNIYNNKLVRLYLIYSLIIPKELPSFLEWLNTKDNGKNLNAEHYQISIELSRQILEKQNPLTKNSPLQDNVIKSIDSFISNSVNSYKLSLLSDWLILDQMGIWGHVYNSFYKYKFWDNIEQISINKYDKLSNIKFWQKITQDIVTLRKNGRLYISNKNYLPLAHFFESIGDHENNDFKINYTLSAIFYSLGIRFVPNTLWKKLNLPMNKQSWVLTTKMQPKTPIITLHRKLNYIEKTSQLILALQLKTMDKILSILSIILKPISVPIILLPILSLLTFSLGVFVAKKTEIFNFNHSNLIYPKKQGLINQIF